MRGMITSKNSGSVVPLAYGTITGNTVVPTSFTKSTALAVAFDSHSCMSGNQDFTVPVGYGGLYKIGMAAYIFGAIGFV